MVLQDQQEKNLQYFKLKSKFKLGQKKNNLLNPNPPNYNLITFLVFTIFAYKMSIPKNIGRVELDPIRVRPGRVQVKTKLKYRILSGELRNQDFRV